MHVKPTQKTTELHTNFLFDVIDMRGTKGFPVNQKGIVFIHKDNRRVTCRSCGLPIQLRDTYIIRTDTWDRGWRIDHHDFGPLFTAVYGPKGESYFPTNTAAAKALAAHRETVAEKAIITDYRRAS